MASAAPASPPTYLLLTLDYVEDILEKRDPYRAEHIAGAKAQEAAGKCVLAGALQNPTDKGVFVFKDCDEAYVKAFVEGDAYYKAGLVPGYTIRPWMIVVGGVSERRARAVRISRVGGAARLRRRRRCYSTFCFIMQRVQPYQTTRATSTTRCATSGSISRQIFFANSSSHSGRVLTSSTVAISAALQVE